MTYNWHKQETQSKLENALSQERKLQIELNEAESKAIDALSRYKFTMFGYWAGIWVHLNKIEGNKRPNPFKGFVVLAKAERKNKDNKKCADLSCDCDLVATGSWPPKHISKDCNHPTSTVFNPFGILDVNPDGTVDCPTCND